MTAATLTAVDWHKGPMLGFDLETTGVNVETDRTVTAALVRIIPGQHTAIDNHLINPGIDIPKGASDIHGITTEYAQEHGLAPHIVLPIVVGELADAVTAGTPIVTMNGTFDLTILDRDCRRHGVETLSAIVGDIRPVIDVLVLDRNADPFRKGKRNLGALCAHYGVTLDQAHNSGADAIAACRVAYKIAVRHEKYRIDLNRLHDKQIDWAKGQYAGYAQWRARKNDPLDPNETHNWPIRPIA